MAACSFLNLFARGATMAALLALTACGGGVGSAPPTMASASARPVTLSDIEIAQLLYADNHRTPDGFYRESAPTITGYLATSHLKNTDLPSNTIAAQYELCTDDWAHALDWSDQVAAATTASILSDTNTTTSYFEFGRVQSTTPPGYLRMRVYRCGYLDRGDVDLRNASGNAGILNQRPIAASDLQQLAEYLWQFTPYNNYGNAVLKSSGSTTSTGLQHTLIIAKLTSAIQNGGCDRVNIIGWSHTVDPQTGALSLAIEPLWDFGAQQVAGVVELCSAQ